MPTLPAAIPVVCALIEREGLLLVAQRPAHKHLALKWEFPGGKVEAGEQPEAALVREAHEELGCEIVVLRPLPRHRHHYGDKIIEMIPFVCRLLPESPEPRPHEHVALDWLKPSAIAALDLAAADHPILASYHQGIAG